MMKQCPNCGMDLPEEARFCIHCMTVLNEKTVLKPMKIIGRWQRNSAIALLLCIALVAAVLTAVYFYKNNALGDGDGFLSSVFGSDQAGSIGTGGSTTGTVPIQDPHGDKTDLGNPNDITTDSYKDPFDSVTDSSMSGVTDITSNTETNIHKPPVTKPSPFPSGSGTAEDPFVITTKEHLDEVRNYLSSCFRLGNDIVFSSADFEIGGKFYNGGEGWIPIGSYNYVQPFTGTFDGNGYAIKNLYIRREISREISSRAYVGLFESLEGTVKNLYMENASIVATGIVTDGESPEVYVGGISAVAGDSSVIQNCHFTGNLTGNDYAAGITARSGGVVTDCSNAGAISSVKSWAGGIVGYFSGTITNCSNTGTISSLGSTAGGIIAFATKNGTVNNCHNSGAVSGTTNSAGIAGASNSDNVKINNCSNTGSITSGHDGAGISAYFLGSVSNCYNAGSITSDQNAGGIISSSAGTSDVVINCYNVGNVITESNMPGCGIFGSYASETAEGCYYIDTISRGTLHGTDPCTKGTAEQMKQQSTFVGFDFTSVWTMGSGSYPYPVLRSAKTVS